jgi:predicted nucleotide-binding protein
MQSSFYGATTCSFREGEPLPVARANVLFELGMAIGRIGRSRTFMVCDTHRKPVVISDLEGVIWTGYDGSSTNEIFQSVATACTEIRSEIKKREVGEVWYTEWQMGSKKYVEGFG